MSTRFHSYEPLAMTLLRCVCGGTSVEDLARETGIPEVRIRARVQAAERYLESQLPYSSRPAPETSPSVWDAARLWCCGQETRDTRC
jgi:hypothetical protein